GSQYDQKDGGYRNLHHVGCSCDNCRVPLAAKRDGRSRPFGLTYAAGSQAPLRQMASIFQVITSVWLPDRLTVVFAASVNTSVVEDMLAASAADVATVL